MCAERPYRKIKKDQTMNMRGLIVLLLIFLFAVSTTCLIWEWQKYQREHDELVTLMESNDDFDPNTVDRLWRFKRDNSVSDHYMDLYNRKVKHLPGWTP